MPLILFETEFTDLCVNPRLISIGLVSEDVERAYIPNTYQPSGCGEFARMAVLPQLDGGAARMGLQNWGRG